MVRRPADRPLLFRANRITYTSCTVFAEEACRLYVRLIFRCPSKKCRTTTGRLGVFCADNTSSTPQPQRSRAGQHRSGSHLRRYHLQSRPSPLVCRRRLMPRPVFPVVRLPYDQPDRVARVLDAIRREFRASSRRLQRPAAANTDAPAIAAPPTIARGTAMTVPREPETTVGGGCCSGGGSTESVVDQLTVGVRDCTLTPKPRPEIFVTAGGGAARNARRYDSSTLSAAAAAEDNDDDHGDVPGSYLLVPPVNITAEISRPPLTPALLQYTS